MEQHHVELATSNSEYGISGDLPTNGSRSRLKSTYDAPDGETTLSGEPETIPLWQAIRIYPRLSLYCLCLGLPIISYGYDLAIVGAIPSVDSFRADYGEKIDDKMAIPSVWLSLFIALPAAGGAVGSVTTGWLQDFIGRKWTLLVGSIISALAIAIIFCSFLPPNPGAKRAMFTAGIALQGFSVGVIKIVCMTYISENTPTSLRGSAMALIPTFNLLGQLIGSLITFGINNVKGSRGYLAAFGSQWAWAALSLILTCFLPESPVYHLRRDDAARAKRSATKLFAPRVDPAVMLKQYQDVIEEERKLQEGIAWSGLIRGTNLRRTLIVIFGGLMPALFGLDLLSNASVFLLSLGVSSNTGLLATIAGVVCGILGNVSAMFVLTRIGRRPATVCSLSIVCLLWTGVGVAGFWVRPATGYFTIGAMISVIIVSSLGCWPAAFAFMGEASSLRLRAKTQAVGGLVTQAASVVMGIILPQIFSPDAGNLRGKTGFVYTGLSCIALLITWLWIPEMKGRSMQEIDQMFEMRLPARKFKMWRLPQDTSEETLRLS